MEDKLKKRIYGIVMSVLMAASIITTSFTGAITKKSEAAAKTIGLGAVTLTDSNAVKRTNFNKPINNGVKKDYANLSLWFYRNPSSGSYGKALYCIEPGKHVKSVSSTTQIDSTSIGDYMANSKYAKSSVMRISGGVTSWDDKRLLIAYILGLDGINVGTSSNPCVINNDFTYSEYLKNPHQCWASYTATQILIWEVILGERTNEFNLVDFNGEATTRHVRSTFAGSYITTKLSAMGNRAIKGSSWNDTSSIYYLMQSYIQKHISKLPSFASSSYNSNTKSVSAKVSNGKYVYTVTNTKTSSIPKTWTYTLYNSSNKQITSGFTKKISGNTVTFTFDKAPTSDIKVKLTKNDAYKSGTKPGYTFYSGYKYDNSNTIQALMNGYTDPSQVGYLKLAKVNKGGLKITKKLSRPGWLANSSYYNYSGLKFKITGPNSYSKTVAYGDSTGKLNGNQYEFTLSNLDVGTYTVTEINPPKGSKLSDTKSKTGTVETGKTNTVSFNFTNPQKTGSLKIVKKSAEPTLLKYNYNYSMNVAVFKIEGPTGFTTKTVHLSVDPNDSTQAVYTTSGIPFGTYKVTEISAPQGHKLTSAATQTKTINSDQAAFEFTFTNPVELAKIHITKINSATDKTMSDIPFRIYDGDLTSESREDILKKSARGQKTTNSTGEAEFSDLPYGTYTLVELECEANDGMILAEPEAITLNASNTNHGANPYGTVIENSPNTRGLKVIKADADTGNKITADTAIFGLGVDTNDDGKYSANELIDEETTKNGIATFNVDTIQNYLEKKESSAVISDYFDPDTGDMKKLEHSYYIVELKAPEKYILDQNIVAISESDIDKINSGTGTTIYKTIKDSPEKGNIQIFKRGEVLTDVETHETEYGIAYDTPKYEYKGLEGVIFKFTNKNTGSSFNRTTDKNGEILVKNLPIGDYEIVEIYAPANNIFDSSKVYKVTVTNGTTAIVKTGSEKYIDNARQKVQIDLTKALSNDEDKDKTGIIFGLYANEDIKLSDGKVVIPEGSLVNLMECDAEGNAASKNDIPYGKYYAKELKTLDSYSLNENKFEVEAVPADQNITVVTTIHLNDGQPIINYPENGNLILTKCFEGMPADTGANLNVIGEPVTEDELGSTDAHYTLAAGYTKDTLPNMNKECSSDDLSIIEYIEEDGTIITCYGKQGIPFRIQGTGKDDTTIDEIFYTDENGQIVLNNISVGTYTATEIGGSWTDGFVVSDKFEFTIVNNENTEKAVLNRKETREFEFTKSDISTGEVIPNCGVEIKDSNGKIIFQGYTDENGKIKLKLPLGKYTYREYDAPEGYEIDEGEYPFEINSDTEIYKAEMQDKPILTDISIIKRSKEDKNKTLAGAEFAIYFKDNADKPLQVVTTNKDGKATFKELRYGSYIVKETKAPAGYEVSEDKIEFTIDSEKTYKDTYDYYDVPTPHTGVTSSPLALGGVVLGLSAVQFAVRRRKHKEFR